MKLVSVNMEGARHIPLVKQLLLDEVPDTICLQEAPEFFTTSLQEKGYQTSFAPMLVRDRDGNNYIEGLILASKTIQTSNAYYYYKSATDICISVSRVDSTVANAVLYADVVVDDQTYTIGTTHLPVTANGKTNDHQTACAKKMLAPLETIKPHLLCGDHNMPRGYNQLYNLFTDAYTDTIPIEYSSSMDKDLHRLGPIADQLNAPIFEIYMVDYIFSQPPYQVTNVRLQFGVSDHAAIIATVSKPT